MVPFKKQNYKTDFTGKGDSIIWKTEPSNSFRNWM